MHKPETSAIDWALRQADVQGASEADRVRDRLVLTFLATECPSGANVANVPMPSITEVLDGTPDDVALSLESLESQGLISRAADNAWSLNFDKGAR